MRTRHLAAGARRFAPEVAGLRPAGDVAAIGGTRPNLRPPRRPPGAARPRCTMAGGASRSDNGCVQSLASLILAVGILAFMAIASAFLIWDGLAHEFARGDGGRSPGWRSRARLTVGVLGFAVAVWLALGLFTHVH